MNKGVIQGFWWKVSLATWSMGEWQARSVAGGLVHVCTKFYLGHESWLVYALTALLPLIPPSPSLDSHSLQDFITWSYYRHLPGAWMLAKETSNRLCNFHAICIQACAITPGSALYKARSCHKRELGPRKLARGDNRWNPLKFSLVPLVLCSDTIWHPKWPGQLPLPPTSFFLFYFYLSSCFNDVYKELQNKCQR